MAYRFKLDQSPEKNIRRVLLDQIDGAEKRLGGKGDRAEAVHESRKSFKRIRALLRLVRSGVGETVFDRENAAFRDIANLLATSRDRHVMLQTIAEVETNGGDEFAGCADKLRAMLRDGGNAPSAAGDDERISQAQAALGEARKRIRRLKLESDSFAPIADGLLQTYKRGISHMEHALSGDADEPFHEWRKATQQHWRHMKLLTAAWPAYFEVRAEKAKQISLVLGQDHDLSMLVAFAADRKRSGLAADKSEVIASVCKEIQGRLRREAAAHGKVLFSGKPKNFAKHVAGIWTAAEQAINSGEIGNLSEDRADS